MPTRDDVARLAGVSGASVARAFNTPEKVSRETLQRIQAAAKALNYHPNYYGSALRGKATKQLYAYCPNLINPFFLHVFFGMEEYALANGYQIYLTRTFNKEMILQKRFDGFLFPVYDLNAVMDGIHFLRDQNCPVVVSDFNNTHLQGVPTVSVDVEAAGYMAAKHLFELGHDKIIVATTQIDPKWIGIQRCCRDYNRSADLILLQNPSDLCNYFDIGARCAKQISQMKVLPTAIISANDEIAVGLINGLVRLGINVPEDISIIGFDDAYIATYCNPPLTTIHYPKHRIGQSMAQILISLLNNETTPDSITLETEFVRRESTAKPRSPS